MRDWDLHIEVLKGHSWRYPNNDNIASMMRLKVDMLTILIGLKQTKQIETYLLFPEFARQFSGITKANTYKRYFIAVLVNTMPGLWLCKYTGFHLVNY